MLEIPYSTIGLMFKIKTDNKGQGSAELILIIGGIIVVVLLVGSYISNITENTQKNIENLLKIEKENLINKI
nr:class III signal peptide-containing protein [Methanobrevibacter sp. YE315]